MELSSTERKFLESMVEYCEIALDVIKGMDRETVLADDYTYTVTKCTLFKIGWSAYNLPRDMFDLYPEVDRSYLIAVGYMMIKSESTWTIDGKLVWSMVQDTIPALLPILRTIQRSWQKSVEDIPERYRVSGQYPLKYESQHEQAEVREDVALVH